MIQNLLGQSWVESVVPEQNDIDVYKGGNVAATFTLEIDYSTLTDNTIRVYGSQTGLHPSTNIFFNSANNTMSYHHDSPFNIGEVVTVTLTTGIRNEMGDSMPEPFTWSFTIESSGGDGEFEFISDVPVGDSPTSVITADLDNDGDLDLAVTNNDAGKLSILTNSGSGTFEETTPSGLYVGNFALAVADWDSDRDMDLCVVNMMVNSVTILMNSGDAVFTNTTTISVGSSPRSVVSGDWDGDGDLDLAVANMFSDNVSILTNDGSGYFSQTTMVDADNGPNSVAAGDFDNDGDLDLAVTNWYSDNVSILGNDGEGDFSQVSTWNVGDSPRSITAANLDGDGDLDLVVINAVDNTVSILKNDGNGNFVEESTFDAGGSPWNATVGDFDGDGDIDLFVVNGNANTVSILENDGTGSFVETSAIEVGSFPYSVSAGDFDGDGDLDLSVANNGSNSVSILGNGGSPPLTSHIVSVSPVQNALNVERNSNIVVTFAEDMDSSSLTTSTIRVNGSQTGLHRSNNITYDSGTKTVTFDPDADFFVGEIIGVTLTTGIQNAVGDTMVTPFNWSFTVESIGGAGTFEILAEISAGEWINCVTAGDFDSDGDLDLATQSSDSISLAVLILENDGKGRFSESSIISVNGSPMFLAAGDFDRDNDLDLAVASSVFEGGTLSILMNDGSGVFTNTSEYYIGVPSSLITGDFDGDGDVDLIVSAVFGGGITFLMNDANGSFTKSSDMESAEIRSLSGGDFDGDGDIDLVIIVFDFDWYFSAILFNDGTGNFLEEITDIDPFVNSMMTGDWDADGDLDLVAMDQFSNTVSVIINDGEGSFILSSTVEVGDSLRSLTAGDWDGDGDLDLAVTNYDSDDISILINDGNGSFELTSTVSLRWGPYSQTRNPVSVVSGDLDGDGDLDLMTANQSAGTISLLMNKPLDTPFPPKNLTAIPGDQKVLLTWSPNTEPDMYKYNIYRYYQMPPLPPGVLIDSIFHPDTSYVDSELTNRVTYSYNITAVDSVGNESGFSDMVSATPGGPVWHISTVGSDQTGNGSESNPFASIQKGINIANEGDTVLVQPGTYVENINFNGKNLVIGSLFLVTGDTSYISRTVIDGNENGSVVTFENGEDSTAVLSGVTITNGRAGGGGGIYFENSHASVRNLIVRENRAFTSGGGIYCSNSIPRFTDVVVMGNLSGSGLGQGQFGGGMYFRSSSPMLVNVSVIENVVEGYGGGIVVWNSRLNLSNVVVSRNTAAAGGGIYCRNSPSVNLMNMLIIGNTADTYGGGILSEWNANIRLVNVTLSGNKAHVNGGAIYCRGNSDLSLVNTISWNNSPQEIYLGQATEPDTAMVVFSDVQGGEQGIITNDNAFVYWLEGNIDADPLFADTANGDFRLLTGSPAIDAGTPFFVWEGDTLVNLGSEDYVGSAPDMGAIEYGERPPATLYEAYAPHNTESIGPFALMFRIWDNPDMNIVFKSGYIHYGIGGIQDSTILIKTTYDDSLAYLGIVPKFSEVTGTTELLYYISGDFGDSLRLYWPPNAPDDPATMIFGPDTTAPILHETNEQTDVHYLLPFDKVVKAQVSDDRFGVYVSVHWRIGDGRVKSSSMHQTAASSDFYIGKISDVIRVVGDTLFYWITAMDSSRNLNTTVSEKKWFVGHDYEVIADWENNRWDDWDLNGYITSSQEFEEWGNFFVFNPIQSSMSDTMVYNRPLNLNLFEKVWITIPMWYDIDPVGNVGYFEASSNGNKWTVLETFTGTFGPQSVDISLIPYRDWDSLLIRFRRERSTEEAFVWLMDDIVLHSDSTRLGISDDIIIPEKFVLYQNYPNPFNPVTTIRYDLPELANVRLTIYDLLGREVKTLVDEVQPAGFHQVTWDGRDRSGREVASGVYIYQLTVGQDGPAVTGSYEKAGKMVILK